MNWANFIYTNKSLYPNKVAILDQTSNRELTYDQLWREVEVLARKLSFLGIKKDSQIAYLSENSIEHLTYLFASSYLGAVFVPLNFRLAHNEILEIEKKLAPDLFIVADDIKYLPLGKSIKKSDLENINKEKDVQIINVSENVPVLMLFTSGSTGEPKGVILSKKMLETNQTMTIEMWGLKTQDSTIVETPFFHTGGYNVLCLPLLKIGGTVVIAKKFDVENVYKTIRENEISVYFGVPTMFMMIKEHTAFKSEQFNTVRFFVSGGAPCPVELIQAFQEKGVNFKQGFGLTEVGPNCFLLEEKDAIRKIGSIGRPMPHTKVKIVLENGSNAEIGQVGELLLSGDHVFSGYYKNESVFKNSFSDGFFKTGDLVKIDQEGFFYVVGRKKDMYISGGENVYPGEVEKVLLEIDKINEVAVVAKRDEKWGEVGIAFYRGKHIELNEVASLLDGKIGRYKFPKKMVQIEQFPLLANGKIDRVALGKMASSESV